MMRALFKTLLIVEMLAPVTVMAQIPSIVKLLSDVNSTVARASLEQQKAAVEAKSETLKKLPQSSNTVAQQQDIANANAAISSAQQTLNGAFPHSLQALIEATETIRSATRPVWGLCGNNPWVDQSQSLWKDWSPYITAVSSKLSHEAGSIGLFYQYAKKPDGSRAFYATGATGFVIGDSAILTNRHVLEQYAYSDASGWHLLEGQILTIVFPFEYSHCKPRASPREVQITGIGPVGVEAQDDFAVLLTAPGQLPAPVELAATFDLAEGARVAVVGYPGRPESCNGTPATANHPCTFLTTTQVDLLFQLPDHTVPFPIERIAPGAMLLNPLANRDTFSYDASTWGGSSGSPVISLVDGSVVGLHFEGVGGDVQNVGYNNAISVTRLRTVLAGHGILKP